MTSSKTMKRAIAMARKVKCQYCLKVEESNKMRKSDKGKYYHIEECYEKYLKEAEFKRKEAQKKDNLVNCIAKIHGLDSYLLIPKAFYPYIEDVRNDSRLFGKLKKSYKNGIPYEAIEYTYEYCKDKISWAKQNKEFKNILSELKYGLAIVRNNLADAKNHHEKIKKQKQQSINIIAAAEKSIVVNEKIKNTQNENLNKKKETGIDLSSLFD